MLTLLLGAAAGIGWSYTTKLFYAGTDIRSQGTAWYLLVWGATLALNQLIGTFTGHPPAVSLVLLIAGTGLVLGQSGAMLVRFYQLRIRTGRGGAS